MEFERSSIGAAGYTAGYLRSTWLGSPGLSGHPKSSKSPGFMISQIYQISLHYWQFCCPNDRFVKTNRRISFGNLGRKKLAASPVKRFGAVWNGVRRFERLASVWNGLELPGAAQELTILAGA